MKDAGWPGLPYLDALRPDPGWRADFALLATYSLNLNALVAALLALAGLDDERGSGSKVDLANAIEALKGRVKVLAQRGRVALPAKTPKILGILDQFVSEVPLDEAEGSWHPKIALVRLVSEVGGEVEWRLWLGSRNLTADSSWDAGLVLVGRKEGTGRDVPGIAALGRDLARHAGLAAARPRAILLELKKLRWEMPEGCVVDDVSLAQGAGRELPNEPDGLESLTVISPFLDGTTAKALGRWGDDSTRRVILSTQAELSRLAAQLSSPLGGYADHLYLDAPDDEEFLASGEATAVPDQELPSDSVSEDEEPDPRGLHAKLIYAEHGGRRTLWLGSANATQRGWKGANAEVLARLSVSEEVGIGLETFVKEIAREANLEELPPAEEDELEERLEEARRQVAARWEVTQRVDGETPTLEAGAPPHPDDVEIALTVGILGQPRAEWPRGKHTLELPPLIPAYQTELVSCELSLEDKTLSWIQHTPMDPPPTGERDRQALARYLDPRTFLLWVRSLLAGDALIDGGGDWNAPSPRPNPEQHELGPDWWAPTLEEVLKAWARDPASVAEVDRKVSRYLDVMLKERRDEYTDEDRNILIDFQGSWNVLRSELVETTR